MSENQTNQRSVICSCSGTTKQQIQELIHNGIDSMTEIADQTGAGTGCGSCDILIMQLLAQEKRKTSEAG